MRPTLRRNFKVVAMAQFLSDNQDFMNWWSLPAGNKCEHRVTELVTMANVTRVVVCGLLEVWSSVNEAIDPETSMVNNITLHAVDDLADIVSFGKAMRQVGWAVESADPLGVIFPNFLEYNTPARTRRHRTRKKAERVTARRIDKETNTVSLVQCEAIYLAYPIHRAKKPALKAIAKAIAEVGFETLLAAVQRYAKDELHKLGTEDERFIPLPASWFNAGRYNDEKPVKPKNPYLREE